MTKKRRFILLIFLLFFFFYIASCTFGKSSVKAGKPFPNITLKTLDEKPFSLNSLKGKIVLINLWASWCLPCIKELPDLQELKRRVNSPSFEVLLVGVSDSKENIAKTYRGLG
ncbi:MAG: TlpA family protein disulfide reductase, partial [Candidatus Dadabacteria bacterium]